MHILSGNAVGTAPFWDQPTYAYLSLQGWLGTCALEGQYYILIADLENANDTDTLAKGGRKRATLQVQKAHET